MWCKTSLVDNLCKVNTFNIFRRKWQFVRILWIHLDNMPKWKLGVHDCAWLSPTYLKNSTLHKYECTYWNVPAPLSTLCGHRIIQAFSLIWCNIKPVVYFYVFSDSQMFCYGFICSNLCVYHLDCLHGHSCFY